uniref:Pentacotripeptide-repeat region of PRORP domain-containing protein n=2 Tax=Setaria italica TaxID=4555 RepID=K3ZQP1_SETIT
MNWPEARNRIAVAFREGRNASQQPIDGSSWLDLAGVLALGDPCPAYCLPAGLGQPHADLVIGVTVESGRIRDTLLHVSNRVCSPALCKTATTTAPCKLITRVGFNKPNLAAGSFIKKKKPLAVGWVNKMLGATNPASTNRNGSARHFPRIRPSGPRGLSSSRPSDCAHSSTTHPAEPIQTEQRARPECGRRQNHPLPLSRVDLAGGADLAARTAESPTPAGRLVRPAPCLPDFVGGIRQGKGGNNSYNPRRNQAAARRAATPTLPAAMRRRPEPRLVRSLAITASASPAAPARSLLTALPGVRDAVSYNIVLAALCHRGGDLPAALSLLRDMSMESDPGARPNAISYTTVMRGLCAARRADEAVGLLRTMQARSVRPDVVTYGTLIRGLCDAAEVDGAVELLDEMYESGIEPNVVVYGFLLRGYCKSGRWQDVGKVFEEMSRQGVEPDVSMFTGLIECLCKEGKIGKATKVKDMMVERGLEPNAVTYNVLINSLCKEGSVREAMALKKEMVENGVVPDVVTYNTLIAGLSGVLEMDEAMGLLEEMIQGDVVVEPNVITFSSVLHGLCKIGRMFQAIKVREMMAERGCMCDLVTYNCLIGGFLRVHKVKMVMKLLNELASSGLEPDSFTYSILINGFSKMWDVDRAEKFLCTMRQHGIEPERVHYIPLLAAICQQGMMERATILFNEMDKNCGLDVFAYNTMIHGACISGDKKMVKQLLKDMLDEGLTPDAATYSVLINMFAKLGDLEEAETVLKQMTASGFVPDIAVFDSLIKGYSAEGQINKVLKLVHELRDKNVALDSKIIRTIMNSLMASNEDKRILEGLPDLYLKNYCKATPSSCPRSS